MPDDESLIPSLSVILERLTRNQRERSLLRALFRLAIRATNDQPCHEAQVAGVGLRPDPVWRDARNVELHVTRSVWAWEGAPGGRGGGRRSPRWQRRWSRC